MADSKTGKTPSSDDSKSKKNQPADNQVAKTRLDISMGDLIDPLAGPLNESQNSTKKKKEKKVAKTMLETDGPSIERIKELAELNQKQQADKVSSEPSMPSDVSIKELAQTIPDPDSLRQSGRQETVPDSTDNVQVEQQETNSLKELAKTLSESETSATGDNASDQQSSDVSLKALAKTIPDPQMRERKAVAARIARIRSFQKTVQSKVRFSKTMAGSSLELLDSLRDGSLSRGASGANAAEPSADSLASSRKSEASNTKASSVRPAASNSEPSAETSTPINSQSAPVSDIQKQPGSPAPTLRKPPPAREQFIARTKLDHDILLHAVSESKLREEARVAAYIVEKSKEPPKPAPQVVKADKSTGPCPFVWSETDSKDKFRYCTKCQTPVYNLDGMERPEAEALIFARENLEKFTLYGRADGKFMTSDCPIQARRKKNLIMSLVAGLALLIGAAALVLLMPAPPPVDTAAADAPATSSTPAETNTAVDSVTGAPVKDSNGMITFSSEGRSRLQNLKTAGGTKRLNDKSATPAATYQTFKLPSAANQSSRAPDPDEDGHFWKFE